MKELVAWRNDFSPKKIILFKASDLIDLMNLSMCAFKLGLRGGRRNGFTSSSFRISRNPWQNLVSRAHGLIGDLVAEVVQSRLDPIVTPGRILPGELQDQIHDHLGGPRSAHGFPLLAVIPLLGHEFAMPAEDRVRRNDRGQLQ